MSFLCCRNCDLEAEAELKPKNVMSPAKEAATRTADKVEYKLRYFEIRGLGEPIRLMFHYANVPFEDIRVTQQEWSSVKPTTRIGKLPELEADGRKLSQSMAIARFLADKFGLGARTESNVDWERAQIDEVGDSLKDMSQELAVYVGTALGLRKGKKSTLRQEVFEPVIAAYLPIFATMLAESNSGFLTNSGITWVDFFVFEYFSTLKNIEATVFGNFPILVDYMERVQALPQLRDYLSSRQQSIM